jgi:DNA-binding HxlR family transcriptional regulator
MDNPKAHSRKEAINSIIELLHTKWNMRIIWELRLEPKNFRELRQACDNVSPTTLNRRIATLRSAGLISHTNTNGYALTEEGKGLLRASKPLFNWAARWYKEQEMIS